MSIPLNFRVPNAPPTFVGREPELRALRAALRRAPVVALCGMGGLGKTSLALAGAKKLMPDRLRAAVIARITPGPAPQAQLEILRALGALAGKKADFASLASQGELLGLALDLAEESAALVVLDDVHHGGIDMLVTAARYARRSTWIATSRVEPDAPELAGQIVRIGPLPDGKLASLARMLAPRASSSVLRDAVRAATGSPWRLRSALLGEPARDSPSGALDAHARLVLDALDVAERPLGIEALTKIAGVDVAPAVEDLARRGLVELLANGVRLHDAARPSIAERRDPTRVRDVGRALATSSDEGEAVEGLRILLDAGDEDSARALCDSRGAALLRAGWAPTMWKLLGPLDDPRWYAWKLRTAMQLATVDVVEALPPPPPDAGETSWERVLWARALLVRGDLARAEKEADQSRHSTNGALAFWAGVVHAMAVHHRDRADRALALLDVLAPPDPISGAFRDALLAFWTAECGDPTAALALVARAARANEESSASLAGDVLGAPIAFFVRYYRMAALMECGRLDEAHAAMTSGAHDDLGEELSAARIAGNALANLALARGRLAEARERLERLARVAGPVTLGDVTALLALERRIAAGELSGAEQELDRLGADSAPRMPLVAAWCVETRERLLALLGRAPDDALDLDALPLGPGTRGIVDLRRAIREARWGAKPAARAVPQDVEGAILHAMLESVTAIVAGRDGSAPARKAIELARAHGWAIRELEARELAIEAMLARALDASTEIDALQARALEIGSRRFELDAAFLRQLARPEVDAPLLEALADAMDAAPIAARRARVMLGGTAVAIDEIDRIVSKAARVAPSVATVGGSDPRWRRGWGLDVDKQILWREDGTTESLARHALYVRILTTLANRGGAASTEDLARDVWNVRSFRPISDGNRIRVTMHRIRSLVGAERIVLRDSGYALGGPPFRLVGVLTKS